jgi:cell division protein FtsQ
LLSLPWLAGVALAQAETGFAPLPGMARVADLLATAAGNIPRRYADWQVVSLERYASDGEILVRTKGGPEVIFGTREDFFTQVARLDLILERAQSRPDQPLRAINLAVGPSQVPVALDASPAATLVSPPRSQPRRPNT